jgi:hypothetical protein
VLDARTATDPISHQAKLLISSGRYLGEKVKDRWLGSNGNFQKKISKTNPSRRDEKGPAHPRQCESRACDDRR